MAKTDWSALQTEFTREHMRTGISAQDWCEKKGLKYASARRYIKPHQVKAAQKEAEKCAPNCAKDAKGKVRKIKRSRLRKKPEVTEGDKNEAEFSEHANHHSDNSQSDEKNMAPASGGRDGGGRFTSGHTHSRGNSGNPFPVNKIQPGERRALKHGGYAKYLKADEYFEDAREMTLQDELDFARARTISLTKTMESLAQIAHDPANDAEIKMEAINKMLAAEAALDRNIRTIESVERTIDQLVVSTVNVPRLRADTQRIIAATRKLTLEADKLSSEGKDKHTPMSEMLEDIQQMGNSGMLN